MNREIKFRVYDKELKQYIRKAEGFHVLGEVMAFGVLETYMRENPCDKMYLIRWNDMLLQQFTGFKDKNGKDIYDGDLIQYKGYEVRDGKQIRPIRIKQIGKSESYRNGFIDDCYILQNLVETDREVEVIGNSFENPI